MHEPIQYCSLIHTTSVSEEMASDSKTLTAAKAAAKSAGCGGGGTGAAAGLRLPEQGLNCPRCDSPNTKFCYYNNYSLTQPRHFCKNCRRYWTKGGALRTVPVGGGCRKNRKSKTSNSSTSSASFSLPDPGMEFHLGSFVPFSAGGIASSIESLSSINQDLHWKLQQQRMQMLFGGDQPHHNNNQLVAEKINNGEIFVESGSGGGASGQGNGGPRSRSSETGGTAWFLDGTFAMPSASSSSSAINETITNANSVTDWNGIAAAWSDMQHFTALP